MHELDHFYFQFRIHTGGGEELHPYMDKDILPNEYGGKAGTFAELNGTNLIVNFILVMALKLWLRS